MKQPIDKFQKERIMALPSAIDNAAAIITKNYLEKLERMPIVQPSEEERDIDISECGSFYKLSRLVMNKEENFLHKLTTIVNVVSSIDCTLGTVIKSDGDQIDYYIGIVSKNVRGEGRMDRNRRKADAAAFHGAIDGNLIGSETKPLTGGELEALKNCFNGRRCYSSISGIVALRDKRERNLAAYVQGLENLTDSLRGQAYTIVMLADPLETSEIQTIRQGYETLYTELSAFEKSTLTLNESDTVSLSSTQTTNFSKNISQGINWAQGRSTSRGTNSGWNAGANAGINIGIASFGVSGGYYSGEFDSTGENSSMGGSVLRGTTIGTGTSKGVSTTENKGKSLQLNSENRTVKSLLEKIDKQLKRLDECESFGAFDCAAYVVADTRETALTVASNYNALMRGEESSIQASQINSWDEKDARSSVIGQYLRAMSHPRFWQDKDARIIVTPASIVSGDELAIEVGLPKRSVPGITVIPMAPFGRNVFKNPEKSYLRLGKLYHMGREEEHREVPIDIESLSMHTFITGSTGAGKSTTIYTLLDELHTRNVQDRAGETIKFMVVEPAKGEYKNRFGNEPDVHVYGTNARKTPLLRINPFSLPEDVHVLEHIDRLIEIFNVCWPMYAAMPAVLKDAVEQAYISSGWNLETSECKYKNSQGISLYPTFADVLREITQVMDRSSYSADSKGDYKGALCTRLKSLTNGLYRQIFTSDELSGKELFDENVIIDLSRTGSSETKALIMGLLVMKMQEYRMAHADESNAKFKHVTILEEAHHLLKRATSATGAEGANMLGKSVEMLSNSIAEMRTYGEGFIIADQAPGLMDLSVIRNTNTKIILRLPDKSDRELVGRAAGLNDGQIDELSKLKTFVAAVYQNDWTEPVLCHMNTNFPSEVVPYRYRSPAHTDGEDTGCLQFLLISFVQKKEMEKDKLDKKYIDSLIDRMFRSSVSAETKTAFIRFARANTKEEMDGARQSALYGLVDAEKVFERAGSKARSADNWYRYIKEALEPSLLLLRIEDRDKLLAYIAIEQAERTKKMEFNELVDYIFSPQRRV